MPRSAARPFLRRLHIPFARLALFLQGKRQRVRLMPLPDGNIKKKTITTRQWQGVHAIWHNRYYRIWLGIWLLTMLIFAALVFGEPLTHRWEIAAAALGMRPDGVAATQSP